MGRWRQLVRAGLPRRGRRVDRPEPGGLDVRQEETRRLLDAGEPAMQTVCTLTLYEGNRAALQWEALSLSFELPAADAQRLAALLPEANP